MKMTDVIVGLRDLNPALQESFAGLSEAVEKVKELASDNDSTHTLGGRMALGSALYLQAMILRTVYDDVQKNVAKLDGLVKSYTRTLVQEKGEESTTSDPAQMEFEFKGSGADDPSEGDGATVLEPDRDAFVPQGE